MSELFYEGPCSVCGDTDYPIGSGNPIICLPCHCGVTPDTNRFRRELRDTRFWLMQSQIANQACLSYFEGELADDPENEMAAKLAKQLREALVCRQPVIATNEKDC